MTRTYFAAAIAILGLLASPALARQVERLNAFTGKPDDSPEALRAYDLRARAVNVNLSGLRGVVAEQEIGLDLFGDVSLVGIVERVERRSAGGVSISGRLAGDPLGWFALVVETDVAVGLIDSTLRQSRFELGLLPNGTQVVRELAPGQFPQCGNGPQPRPRKDARKPTAADGSDVNGAAGGTIDSACVPLQPVFDVMVVFTDNAVRAAGGFSAIAATAQLAIDLTNQAYRNSRIDARMRLVFRAEVAYVESGRDFSDHLSNVTDPSDGVIDIVNTWRNTYKADFVSFWVDDTDGGTLCGRAHCDVDEDEAYSVCNWTCAAPNFTFQHEIGHNQGCAHDDENCSFPCTCAHFSDSYAWRFFGMSGSPFRTVMAVQDPAVGYTRINWFSNFGVNFDGVPTGLDDEAENADTIDELSSHYEGFRASGFDVWVNFAGGGLENGSFGRPFNRMVEGVNAIVNSAGASETPTLHLYPGTSAETLTINKLVTLRACGGTVRIGE